MTTTTPREPKSAKRGPAPSPAYLRIGTRYRPSRIDDHYDVLVIGSGPGGLSSAVCLSAMGSKVAVLEQHYTAGGFTHAYGRHGYEWDVGVHYIGDMGHTRSMGYKLFRFLTNDKLKWADMGEPYDTVFLGDDFTFAFPKGQKTLAAKLKDQFPGEQRAIDQYFSLIRRVGKSMPLFALPKIAPTFLGPLLRLWQKRKLPPEMFEATGVVLDRLTSNKKLKAVLTTQWGDCGLPPAESSFIIHSLIARHYLNGGYYPIGGASEFAKTMLPQIQATGGNVFTYARVDEILVENNCAVGVKMADGHRIMADKVISAAGADLTLNRLLPKALANRIAAPDAQDTVQPSMGHFSVYIGLNASSEALNLPKSNFWIYPDEHHDENVSAFMEERSDVPPIVYVSFPSAKDPSWDERYPNKATIEIVAAAKHDWFKAWENETWGQRGEDYEAIKQAWQEKLINALLKKLPHLEAHIDYAEIATPLSTQYFCEYRTGEIYGLDHRVERFRQPWLQPRTPIKNLYLTGQDIMTCGIVGAAMSGVLTSIAVLGWRKGMKLRKMIQRNQHTPASTKESA